MTRECSTSVFDKKLIFDPTVHRWRDFNALRWSKQKNNNFKLIQNHKKWEQSDFIDAIKVTKIKSRILISRRQTKVFQLPSNHIAHMRISENYLFFPYETATHVLMIFAERSVLRVCLQLPAESDKWFKRLCYIIYKQWAWNKQAAIKQKIFLFFIHKKNVESSRGRHFYYF